MEVEELMTANADTLDDPDRLAVGQVIGVPCPRPTPIPAPPSPSPAPTATRAP
jgi:hypothetical protein